MTRRVPAIAAAATLLAGVVGGCGGDRDAVDAAALRSQLTAVADAMDRCVARTNDARRCTGRELGAVPSGTQLGDGVGQIDVRADRPLRYRLSAEAGDAVTFSVIAQPVGARSRVCTPAGRGDCPARGAW